MYRGRLTFVYESLFTLNRLQNVLLKILERVKRIVGEGGYKENHRERKKILETVSVDESKVIIELLVFCGYGGKMCI